jgi:hypothetical protein
MTWFGEQFISLLHYLFIQDKRKNIVKHKINLNKNNISLNKKLAKNKVK